VNTHHAFELLQLIFSSFHARAASWRAFMIPSWPCDALGALRGMFGATNKGCNAFHVHSAIRSCATDGVEAHESQAQGLVEFENLGQCSSHQCATDYPDPDFAHTSQSLSLVVSNRRFFQGWLFA